MFKINLVPELQEKKQKIARLNYIVTTVCISVIGVTVIGLVIIGGFLLTNKTMISKTEKSINETNKELEDYKELEKMVLSLESGLAGAKQILDGNNAWTKLLPHLEKATPQDVKFTRLSLEPGKISASLDGKNVDAMAKFLESYKKYKLFSISGTGEAGKKISISLDGGSPVEAVVKSSGEWTYPLSFDFANNHTIKIEGIADEATNISYKSDTKELKIDTGNVSTKEANLFSGIEMTQYRKSGDTISFNVDMSFDGSLLW